MKKIYTLLFAIVATLGFTMSAQSDWESQMFEFAQAMNDQSDMLVELMRDQGIECTSSTFYDKANKKIVMDMNFQPYIWNVFNKEALQVAKNETTNQWHTQYVVTPDFKEVIDIMKAHGVDFKVVYSTGTGKEKKDKNFIITPQEIINYK